MVFADIRIALSLASLILAMHEEDEERSLLREWRYRTFFPCLLLIVTSPTVISDTVRTALCLLNTGRKVSLRFVSFLTRQFGRQSYATTLVRIDIFWIMDTVFNLLIVMNLRLFGFALGF